MGYTVEIVQPDKLKKVKKFITPNGQIKDGGIENLGTMGNDMGGHRGNQADEGRGETEKEKTNP